MSSQNSGKSLIECQYQALKVRIVLWCSIVVAIIALGAGCLIFQSFGLSHADGGVLRPLGERLMFGGFVALLGLVFAAGMLVYVSSYIVELRRSGDMLVVSTMGLLAGRTHHLNVIDVGELNYYAGRLFIPRGAMVEAPWYTMPVRGRWLPYLIDAQAEHVDRSGLERLEKDALRGRLETNPGAVS